MLPFDLVLALLRGVRQAAVPAIPMVPTLAYRTTYHGYVVTFPLFTITPNPILVQQKTSP